MSLQSWVLRFVERDRYSLLYEPYMSNPRGPLVFECRVHRIASDNLLELESAQWNELLSRLCDYGSTHLWNPTAPLERRTAFLGAMVQILERVNAEHGADPGAVFMFWDVMLDEPNYSSYERLGGTTTVDSGRTILRERIFDVLASHLRQSDRSLQRSALHGLNHLLDWRANALIASLRADLFDDEVRTFADACATMSFP